MDGQQCFSIVVLQRACVLHDVASMSVATWWLSCQLEDFYDLTVAINNYYSAGLNFQFRPLLIAEK